MVCNMLGKDHEGHGYISHSDSPYICAIQLAYPLERRYKGKFRKSQEGFERDTVRYQCLKGSKVDNQKGIISGGHADQRKRQRYRIPGHDANDKGNQPSPLAAENGADNNHKQSDQTAQQRNVGGSCGNIFYGHIAPKHIAYGIAGQAETNDSHGGSDDYGGHKLINPLHTCRLYGDGQDHIHQTGKSGAQDQPQIPQRHGCSPCKGRKHGAQKSEGRAQKHRAAELGKQLIDNGADTCAEQCSGSGHPISHYGRHSYGCSHDSQQLLEGESN